MDVRAALTGLAKLAGVVLVGAGVGAGLGIGLAELGGGGGEPLATAPAAQAAEPVVEVLDVDYLEAQTASGIARQRARVSVRLRIANATAEPLTTERPVLVTSGGRLTSDPNADDAAGELLGPIAPGATAEGVVRFETAGAVTRALVADGTADVRVAGRTVTIEVDAAG